MLVGVSQKNDFGRNVQNKEQYDFRDRLIIDDEEEAIEHLKKLNGVKWAKEAITDASIHTLVDGELDTDFSPSYIAKQMGW